MTLNQPFAPIKEPVRLLEIDAVDTISGKDFHENYVSRDKPLLIRKMTQNWEAIRRWSPEYFSSVDADLKVPAKDADVTKGTVQSFRLEEYVSLLMEHERMIEANMQTERPPYLHDVPIFHLIPFLRDDIHPFPLELFPEWYHDRYYNYIQFFMGGTSSLTPLHFDTLCTHNLFFQVFGFKLFILVPGSQRSKCGIKGWRWAQFNPLNPDYEKFPEAKDLDIRRVTVGPGDILYMPPKMLHQVHGLSFSLSFNIDWHTKKSSLAGLMSLFQGAPTKNAYYNSLLFSGLNLGIPPRFIFRFYKSYLNYIS